MRLARLTASIALLQGLLPLLVFGGWRPGGLFLVGTAAVYVLLSWALWTGRRWALPLGLLLTLPQLLVVSSWLVSWRVFVGTSIGLGAKPALDVLAMPLSVFWHVGSSYFAACFGYDPAFVPEGESRTSAEMEPEEKDAARHRARALRALLAELHGLR